MEMEPAAAAGPTEGARPDAVDGKVADPGAAGPKPTPATADDVSTARPGADTGRLGRLVTLPGSWGALVLGCLSFTPSLLPRGGLLQGLVWGISAAIGYGLGVLVAWVWRAFADRDPRPPRSWSWPTFLASAGVLLALSFGLGQYWQHEIRRLMGVTEVNLALVVASPLVAAATFWLMILGGRGLRR